jgi:3-isopropylmalate/(R)-2-methylmalate dehydratase large subunit
MTLCNMAVEFSAFTGLVAPDQAVFDYLQGRPFAPKGAIWTQALQHWSTLQTDDGAHFDREIVVDSQTIGPMVTWGTSPQHAVSINANVPDPGLETDSHSRTAMERALAYMDLQPGQSLTSVPINAAFIGSCTNSRLSDLQAAAQLLRGRRVARGVKAICVPGSSQVKRAAEAQGLHEVFVDAGFEWREPGCSMCFFAGGESFGMRERVVSTTNRNFESRQGPQTRSHLASPLTVAASALAGHLADPRDVVGGDHG